MCRITTLVTANKTCGKQVLALSCKDVHAQCWTLQWDVPLSSHA